jgi:hypothetical protein
VIVVHEILHDRLYVLYKSLFVAEGNLGNAVANGLHDSKIEKMKWEVVGIKQDIDYEIAEWIKLIP